MFLILSIFLLINLVFKKIKISHLRNSLQILKTTNRIHTHDLKSLLPTLQFAISNIKENQHIQLAIQQEDPNLKNSLISAIQIFEELGRDMAKTIKKQQE